VHTCLVPRRHGEEVFVRRKPGEASNRATWRVCPAVVRTRPKHSVPLLSVSAAPKLNVTKHAPVPASQTRTSKSNEPLARRCGLLG